MWQIHRDIFHVKSRFFEQKFHATFELLDGAVATGVSQSTRSGSSSKARPSDSSGSRSISNSKRGGRAGSPHRRALSEHSRSPTPPPGRAAGGGPAAGGGRADAAVRGAQQLLDGLVDEGRSGLPGVDFEVLEQMVAERVSKAKQQFEHDSSRALEILEVKDGQIRELRSALHRAQQSAEHSTAPAAVRAILPVEAQLVVEELERRVQLLEGQLEEAQRDNQQQRAAYELLQTESDQMATERTTMEQQLEQQLEGAHRAQKQQELTASNTQLKQANAELQIASQAAAEQQSSSRQLKHQLGRAEEQVDTLLQEVETLRRELEEASGDWPVSSRGLQDQIDLMQHEIENLEEQRDQASETTKKRERQLAGCESELAECKKQLEFRDPNNRPTLTVEDEVEFGKEIAALKHTIVQRNAKAAALEIRVDEATAQVAHYSELLKQQQRMHRDELRKHHNKIIQQFQGKTNKQGGRTELAEQQICLESAVAADNMAGLVEDQADELHKLRATVEDQELALLDTQARAVRSEQGMLRERVAHAQLKKDLEREIVLANQQSRYHKHDGETRIQALEDTVRMLSGKSEVIYWVGGAH